MDLVGDTPIAMDSMTLEQLRKLRAELEEQIDRKHGQEQEKALATIAKLAHQAGLTAKQVAQRLSPRRKRAVKPKYRDPESGMEWAGRGKKPAWVRSRLAEGLTLDDLLIDREHAPKAPKAAVIPLVINEGSG